MVQFKFRWDHLILYFIIVDIQMSTKELNPVVR